MAGWEEASEEASVAAEGEALVRAEPAGTVAAPAEVVAPEAGAVGAMASTRMAQPTLSTSRRQHRTCT